MQPERPDRPAESQQCCFPDDIVVMPASVGYLIGRVLAPAGPGPWWSYITIAATYEDAIYEARHLAEGGTGRAWIQRDHESFEPIPSEPAPPSPAPDTSGGHSKSAS
jgi:hypothetical protein